MVGVIFDFNGTLVADETEQIAAWQRFSQEYSGRRLTESEFLYHVHGQNNFQTISYILNRAPGFSEAKRLSELKDKYYRDACQSSAKYQLSNGVESFLNQLKQSGVPCNIATGSIEANVDFYFEKLSLSQWFDRSKVVFDDGHLLSKPHPDAFIKSAARVGLSLAETIVFEDSQAGIAAASEARCGLLVAVEGTTNAGLLKRDKRVDLVIRDFEGLGLQSLQEKMKSKRRERIV